MKNEDISKILELPFYCGDLNATVTIREYLIKLLLTLWDEVEGFSGKRPFGNSGWSYDMAVPLIEHEYLAGELDADKFVRSLDDDAYDGIIADCIKAL